MPPTQENTEVIFPLGGMDVTCEFGVQPPGTTPSGVNVRALDPILQRNRGGSRHGLSKFADQIPEGAELIQHLAQLVDPRADNLIGNWDYGSDYIPDPRNPDRLVPPLGSGSTPSQDWPPNPYRRLLITASSNPITDGSTLTLTVLLTDQPADTPVVGGEVTLATYLAGHDGQGDTATTDGSGNCTFTVSEASFEGPIVYMAMHDYVRSGQVFPSVARSMVVVNWLPNYTLTLTSPDGLHLDDTGDPHFLIAKLIDNGTGKPVAGRQILLSTVPFARVGDESLSFTDSSGKASFVVSDTNPESVDYTASLSPNNTLTDTVTIQWGNLPTFNFVFTCPQSSVFNGTSVLITATVTDAATSALVNGVSFDITAQVGTFFESGSGGTGVAQFFFTDSNATVVFTTNSIQPSVDFPHGGNIGTVTPCTVTWHP